MFQNISAGVIGDPVDGGPRYLQQPAQVEIKTKGKFFVLLYFT
jgi:hypothetical protein